MLNSKSKIKEVLPGTFLVSLEHFKDERGSFVKTFNRLALDRVLPTIGSFNFEEEFYSISNKGVLRGMHFQLPPHDHEKIVFCAVGVVHDVLVDLRSGATYGDHCEILLNADQPKLLYIPRGIAHGFLSCTDKSLMVYKTSSIYSPSHDLGIHYNSFGYNWKVKKPIISFRDQNHTGFDHFETPF